VHLLVHHTMPVLLRNTIVCAGISAHMHAGTTEQVREISFSMKIVDMRDVEQDLQVR
jgi:hypothetical protein